MLKIIDKIKESFTYELWQQFSNSINGRLMLKLITLKTIIFVASLGILFGYIGAEENKIKFKMNENLDYSQKLTQTILNKVDRYFYQLIMLAYLTEQSQTTNQYVPMTIENLTMTNDTFTQKYLIQHNLNQNNISLYRSIYKAYGDMNEEAWQQTVQLAQVDKYILEFMFYYDEIQTFFTQFYLINKNHKIMHYFPVVDEIQSSMFNLEQKSQILYSNTTIIFTQETSYGLIAGIGQTQMIANILSNIDSSFFIKIFQPNNTFYVSNNQQMSDQCECEINTILNISKDCEIPQGNNSYYYSSKCNSLYLKDISTSIRIKIYLVIYKESIDTSGNLRLLNLAWPYYLVIIVMFIINILIIISRINLFTRDITNPIKQVTYKIDKFINNIFQSRVISKIQAEDILIKEETEVQSLVQEFSKLLTNLKNKNTLNVQTLEKKEKKDIIPKQNDKTIEQIKNLVNKFRESL